MAEFSYGTNGGTLNASTLSSYFNRHRAYKYILDGLIKAGKHHLSEYKVLEPACGSGDKLRFLTEWGVKPENCFGFDIADSAIELCQKLSVNEMNFQVADAFDMPYDDEQFDIIICSGLFACYTKNDEVFKLSQSLSRVLKSGGLLMVCDLNENFKTVYANNEAMMAKSLRGYNSKIGELEILLGNEFKQTAVTPLFAADMYNGPDGSAVEVKNFPAVEYQIEHGNLLCSYSFWTFTKHS